MVVMKMVLSKGRYDHSDMWVREDFVTRILRTCTTRSLVHVLNIYKNRKIRHVLGWIVLFVIAYVFARAHLLSADLCHRPTEY